MKRGAERQLTKDGGDDDDIEEIQDPQAFQKADEATLARRQIRALPKRSLTASKPPSFNGLPPVPPPDVEKTEAVPQPRFGGFVGFGAATSTSNPFTFTATPPAASVPSPSAFDATPKSAQQIPSSASSFFGVLNSASDASPPNPATSSPAEETDTVALKYFKSLRGLNVSFLSAISAAVEKDPFFDVANLVESYKNLRTTIQSEFDDSSKPSAVPEVVMTNSAQTGAKPLEKTTSLFSILKPLEAPPSTSESGAKTGGFTFLPFVPPPSSSPTLLPFGLTRRPGEPSTSSSAATPEPPKSAFIFGTSNTSTSTSTQPSLSSFPFSTFSSMENTSKSVLAPSGQETEGSSASSSRPTSTAPGAGPGSAPSFFATTKPTSVFGTSDATSRPASAFGGSVFGNGSTTESSKPTLFNPSSSDNKDSPKVTVSFFGNATAASSSTSTNIFRPPDKSVSVFGSAFQSGTFATGKAGGSIGNPVGFGFGSSPNAGDTTTTAPSTSGFTFGTPLKSNESLFSPPMTDKSADSTPQPETEGNEEGGEEDTTKLLPSHTHDEEGEGEEEEETTHVVRCKVYRLFKSGDKSEWKDLGIGMFRLKKHKETNVRRVLMRNSNTGRILINFRIHGSLKPTLAKTAISFVGYDNSTPTSFSIRVKTEEQAKDLKEALEREITAVQTGPE